MYMRACLLWTAYPCGCASRPVCVCPLVAPRLLPACAVVPRLVHAVRVYVHVGSFVAARLPSPVKKAVGGPRSPPKLFRRATGLSRDEAYTTGRSSVLTKCLVRLVLGFARQSVVECVQCFFDRTLRIDVVETMTCTWRGGGGVFALGGGVAARLWR